MSYDVGFEIGGYRVILPEHHQIIGGTHAVGGTREAWLNITYNYGEAFRTLFGEEGIRSLYGLSAKDVRAKLSAALEKGDSFPMEEHPCSCGESAKILGHPRRPCSYEEHDSQACYWAVTRKNVLHALRDLRSLAELCPDEALLGGD